MILENGLVLAYIGDAIYELKIREYLINRYSTSVNNLHKDAISYTSSKAQSYIIDNLYDSFLEEEIEIYKRGRNSGGTHKPKNSTLFEYRKATGFESLIGYLYLKKDYDRLDEIMKLSIDFINNRKSLELEIK